MATRHKKSTEKKDFMRWGVAAVASVALAVMSTNLAAYLPENWLVGLHATRIETGNMVGMKAEVDRMRIELARAERTNAVLNTRVSLMEDNRTNFARRVGALELSIPMLLESLPPDADLDYNLLTAAIGEDLLSETREVEGGILVVKRSPMFPSEEELAAANAARTQPMPDSLDAVRGPLREFDGHSVGLVIGAPVAPGDAPAAWQAIRQDVGGLLIGLDPLLDPKLSEEGETRLIAGPVASLAEAERLCAEIGRAELQCSTADYAGVSLPSPAR
ncbi:hypothetical protein [Cucumibacter marinus]|uniref:hypothetical protein n=1 Tax=Cucumibacter marinus TaxID=1121252 RepID=UPI0003F82FB6|nr:hypothetical protein [Cucumibacter marinus]